ncbi:MAG TPA: HAMP domain-containing sensor histidine kinase [Aggregatilineaceae bacterium]|nr:HAMP domain-containing sensor histidine kinase [Aggregatilineaceae bacterium]
MAVPKSLSDSLDFRAILDGLGQGVLIFDMEDRLVLDNVAARTILGANLVLVRAEGWRAAAVLFDAVHDDRPTADEIRARALRQAEPVRFHTFLSGAYTPCWATAIYGPSGSTYTMITLERPDWSALTELMSTFRAEARMSITSTRGHAELIKQVITKRSPNTTVDQLAKRVGGFADIMAIHMYRLEMLMDLLHRLEVIRTGQLIDIIRANRKAVPLAGFLEDWLEDTAENSLIEAPDPNNDPRERISMDIPDDVVVSASKQHLSSIFRDLLRNSIMYSEPGTPITIRAIPSPKTRSIQIDIVDEGYGIRQNESSKVFIPFQRARQPQILAEFGYGLSLYLVKMEIEAMGGRIWFTSEEGVGTTLSFKLLLWRTAEE